MQRRPTNKNTLKEIFTYKMHLKNKLKAGLPNFILTAITSVLCILLAEYVLRIAPQSNDNMPLKISISHFSSYLMQPNQSAVSLHGKKYETNSLGLRDKPLKQPFGEVFALVAGDSSTMGYGVQEHERFSNILSQEISRRPSFATDVGCIDCNSPRILNAGHSGYQAIDNVGMINNLLDLGIRPKLLIIGVMQNDFSESVNYKITDGQQVAVSSLIPPQAEAFLKSTLRNSALYQLIGNSVKRIIIKGSTATTLSTQDLLNSKQKISEVQQNQLHAYLNFVSTLWHANRKVPVMFVLIPSANELNESLDLPTKLLKKNTKKYQCSMFVDPRKELLNSNLEIKEIYALNDRTHPSHTGHKIIAETIQVNLPKLFDDCNNS